MWLNIIEEAVCRGESTESIQESVLAKDESIQKAVPALRINPIHRKTLVENSIQGFIDFAKNPEI